MSTRCHIELHDKYNDAEQIGVRLYHHSDGYPSFMGEKLNKFLPAAYEFLKEAGHPYWWDSERVGAVLIALSMEDYYEPLKPFSTDRANGYTPGNRGVHRPDGGVPVFQPCLEEHDDVVYIYKVVLDSETEGKYQIFVKYLHDENDFQPLSEVLEAIKQERNESNV
jgi:hypothetical protein